MYYIFQKHHQPVLAENLFENAELMRMGTYLPSQRSADGCVLSKCTFLAIIS
jgi:hypothetical protein